MDCAAAREDGVGLKELKCLLFKERGGDARQVESLLIDSPQSSVWLGTAGMTVDAS
jgi:hypothetical protein